MSMTKGNEVEDNLSVINRKIIEIKKKIQLSEGQRKAHFEECDAEKKRNTEKILILKKNLKEIYDKLKRPKSCTHIILKENEITSVEGLRNKKVEEAIHFIDCKCMDLKKQLDVLKYRNKMKKSKLKELIEEYRRLLCQNSKKEFSKRDEAIAKPMSEIENQIHRIKMSMMEADLVNKKYKTICLHFLSDRVKFDSSLQKIEEEINKQNEEMKQLEKVNKEALGLRDLTKGTLLRHEISALNAAKHREGQYRDFRNRVEERRLELEKLERKIFPTGKGVFEENSEGNLFAPSSQNESSNATVAVLQAFFQNLKSTTGETDTEDVLSRFMFQKKTKERLEMLRNVMEEKKKKLENLKEKTSSELEALKFSVIKDKEENQEEIEKFKKSISDEDIIKENLKKKLEKVKEQLSKIKSYFDSFIRTLQDTNEDLIAEPSEEVQRYSDSLNSVTKKIKSGFALMGLGENLRETLMYCERSQYQQYFSFSGMDVAIEESSLFSRLGPPEEGKSKAQQTSLMMSETDDDEDIPNRVHLKRQAQLIVDAKSRKKFNRVLNYSKFKK